MTQQRWDAATKVFFEKQLEHLISATFDIKFPQILARTLYPVSFEAGAGATTITWRAFTQIGQAKLIGMCADDLPRVDITGEETTTPVKEIGASYGWCLKEVRSAQMAGLDLNPRRAMACREAILREENQIAFFGDDPTNLPGMFSNANIPLATAAADGVGASTMWADKTPDQIIRDLGDMLNGIVELTRGVEIPNTLVLPIAQMGLLATRRMTDGSDRTILGFFLANNPYITSMDQIFIANEMTEPDAGWPAGVAFGAGNDVAMAYNRDPLKLTMHVPSEFEQLAPEIRGLETVVNCQSSTGGVIVYYPLSVTLLQGI